MGSCRIKAQGYMGKPPASLFRHEGFDQLVFLGVQVEDLPPQRR
jgi:hypothetical protein